MLVFGEEVVGESVDKLCHDKTRFHSARSHAHAPEVVESRESIAKLGLLLELRHFNVERYLVEESLSLP
jgi:hypothetical protein